jgi:endonuclease I
MNKLIGLLLIFISSLGFAQIPNGYYNGTEGLSGDQLKQALHNIIDNHHEYSYSNLRDFILRETDEDPNNSNNVILLYTGRSQAKSTFGGGANDWNREHVWAKSHGNFGTSAPAGTDAHHIRPTDASVNSSRGNLDFDEGGTPLPEAPGCKRDSDSFEPRDEVKGDVARMIFYMATRYEGGGEPDLEVVDRVNNSPRPEHGKLQKLIDWNQMDPPSEFEKNRNEVVYSYQENRNPFIDHPEFVDYIWGDPNYLADNEVITFNFYPNPATTLVNLEYAVDIELNYSIISVDGRNIAKGSTNSGNNTVDISDLNSGLYLFVLKNSNNITVKQYKLLKK